MFQCIRGTEELKSESFCTSCMVGSGESEDWMVEGLLCKHNTPDVNTTKQDRRYLLLMFYVV